MNSVVNGEYVVRAIQADEWPEVKELRLRALQDAVAHLAFLETYEDAAARPDAFWQERALGGAEDAASVRQVVAVAPGGEWVGSVTVLMEEAGSTDWAGFPVERRQAHVVGVYVRPEHRGNGLLDALFAAGLAWAWERGAERARLLVHEDNGRARAAYQKVGFEPSGVIVQLESDTEKRELELVIARG
ncbi:GNAT family N-acetyltransferase [Streptomyces sp. NPDC086787]|uniref:GNAT family N-acetyltransferase n=1 Tax=Streptomyces sp. NPDC086787 TaxID=3365759 RepID=UPI00382E7014